MGTYSAKVAAAAAVEVGAVRQFVRGWYHRLVRIAVLVATEPGEETQHTSHTTHYW